MRLPSWDIDYCFNIDDFNPEDILIVNHHGMREKGQVISADRSSMVIYYKAVDNHVYTATLDDVIYLDDPKADWLS